VISLEPVPLELLEDRVTFVAARVKYGEAASAGEPETT
jgi:hypothetical protein